MSIKKIAIFIVILFMILAGIRFMFALYSFVDGSWGNNKCYDECKLQDINNTCNPDDNNCQGSAHDCYDSCYGGATGRGLRVRRLI